MDAVMAAHNVIVAKKPSSNYSSFNWEMERNIFLPLSCESGCFFPSPCFECFDATWRLHIYPNGEHPDSSEYISLFLELRSTTRGKYDHSSFVRLVDYQISIKDRNGCDFISKKEKNIIKENSRRGWTYFLEKSELLDEVKWLTTLTISCTIICDKFAQDKSPIFSRRSESIPEVWISFQTMIQGFRDAFLQRTEYDFTIKVMEHQIPVHKRILASRSKVFAAMFESDMTESQRGVLEIVEFDLVVVKNFLFYMYYGDVDELTSNNAFDLYIMSNQYDVKGLKRKCLEFIRQNLNVENIYYYFRFADTYYDVEFESVVNAFLITHFEKILSSDQWEIFSNKNTVMANKVLTKFALKNAVKIKM